MRRTYPLILLALCLWPFPAVAQQAQPVPAVTQQAPYLRDRGTGLSLSNLTKAANDTSTLPARLEESGLGDVEGQIRWRWNNETDRRPEIFSYPSS